MAPWPYLASNAGSYQGMISASGSCIPRLASRSASVPGVPGSAPGLMRWEVKCPVAFMRASLSHFSFPLAPKSVSSLRIESRAGGNRRHLRRRNARGGNGARRRGEDLGVYSPRILGLQGCEHGVKRSARARFAVSSERRPRPDGARRGNASKRMAAPRTQFGNEELLIIKNSDYAVTGTR